MSSSGSRTWAGPGGSTPPRSAGRSTTTARSTPGSARRTANGEVGGLNGIGGRGPGGPLVLLYSDDLDATLAAVEGAGGVVTAPPYEFPGGRRFHFADLDGNELGVWAAG